MNGRNGVHGGGLIRAGLPFKEAALALVGPAAVLAPVEESAVCSVTAVSVIVPASIGRG